MSDLPEMYMYNYKLLLNKISRTDARNKPEKDAINVPGIPHCHVKRMVKFLLESHLEFRKIQSD